MTRGVFRYLVASLVCVGLLSGCRFDLFDRREPWRAEAEEKCIAERGVEVSQFIEPVKEVSGRGVCGMEHPFRVTALNDGIVEVQPRATLACPMIRDLNVWIAEVVQPAALAWMGQPVVGIKQMSSYSCRGMNGSPTAKISEHAFGNALDIGAFTFADGREITVKGNWRGPNEARGFLLQVQAGACEVFTTTLAPGSNIFHYDHIHVDLMRRANRPVICQPKAQPMPPPVLVARQPAQQPFFGGQASPPRGGYAPQDAQEPPAPQESEDLEAQQPPQAPSAPAGRQVSNPASGPLEITPQPGYPAPAPSYGQPTYSQPGYAQPSYGPPPQRAYPPAGDARQPVLLPPGGVPQPQVLRPPGPMSYVPAGKPSAPAGAAGPFATGSVVDRKYYSVPMPQASTIPLPRATAGED